jgi:hypothetical protein
MDRDAKPPETLRLPTCPIPRPGDSVVWYSDAMPLQGTLHGHRPDGRPSVRTAFGNESTLPSFDLIRLADPSKALGPNWLRLPAAGKILTPSPHEATEFGHLLSQRIPPGPQYSELVTEIWHRGFEVFLVGGSVRDIISGEVAHDVDLATTNPLIKAKPLLEAMFRHPPSVDPEDGFVRLGGSTSTRDPFIDLKMFSLFLPGTVDAIFGAEFQDDLIHRDFACNALYYDPVNHAIIDPSGRGVMDAEDRRLTLVCDTAQRSASHLAKILVRFFKFLSRGFTASDSTAEAIRTKFLPSFPAMTESMRVQYVRAQLFSKCPKDLRERTLQQFQRVMLDFGAGEIWTEYLEPIRSEILVGDS